MQIPILSGVYTDDGPDIRSRYPRNLIPVPKSSGLANGYLRPADGVIEDGQGPGIDRGGINWQDQCYRVMGNRVVRLSDTLTATLLNNTVDGVGQVSMDYSFDRLAIASGGKLYYVQGNTVTQVTDPDLGTVLDVIWIDGYFMTTDGTNLIITDLTNPLSVNPLKYGSSEIDPDPVKKLLKVHNELYAVNRYSIEVFDNVGGEGFPFQRIEGAHIDRGSIGTHCAVIFNKDRVAFLGSGRNEPPSVYIGGNAQSVKIASREIDLLLLAYTETQLSQSIMETRIDKSHQWIYLHLPDKTLLYDAATSQIAGEPVWVILTSGLFDSGLYRIRNLAWCYNQWICSDPISSRYGHLTDKISSHWGNLNSWSFSTDIVYNEGRGAIFHELELVTLPGRVALGDNPTIWTSYSLDGVSFSQEKPRKCGKRGDRMRRILWLQQGAIEHWRLQKFRGTSDAHISIARLEAQIEGLNN